MTQTQTAGGQRVEFAPGIRRAAGDYLADVGGQRALVLSTPEQRDMAEELAADLGARCVGVFDGAAMHTPVHVTEMALALAEVERADCLVAIGGGSTIGLGKALTLRTGLPQIAIPTTYAGSEATPILGQTENGVKTTMKDDRLRPRVVLYDAELTVGLPEKMTVTSALNAIAHAAEALYSPDRSEHTTQEAINGMRAFARALPRLRQAPDDLAAREAALRGAYSCGYVLGRVGMALHHKLCHTLGGSFDMPHAETHAVILPHAIHYNAAAAPELLAPVAAIFGGEGDAPGPALWAYARALDAPMALRDLGLPRDAVARAAAFAAEKPYPNPAPITHSGLLALLDAAWSGARPGSTSPQEAA